MDGVAESDRELIHRVLAELPRELRDAVEVRYLAGLSPRESAETLGISERALYQRCQQSLPRLSRYEYFPGEGAQVSTARPVELLAVVVDRHEVLAIFETVECKGSARANPTPATIEDVRVRVDPASPSRG